MVPGEKRHMKRMFFPVGVPHPYLWWGNSSRAQTFGSNIPSKRNQILHSLIHNLINMELITFEPVDTLPIGDCKKMTGKNKNLFKQVPRVVHWCCLALLTDLRPLPPCIVALSSCQTMGGGGRRVETCCVNPSHCFYLKQKQITFQARLLPVLCILATHQEILASLHQNFKP